MVDRSTLSFTRRALLAAGVVALVTLLLLLLWYAVDVLLLAFAGVLLAVFLRSLSGWLAGKTKLPAGASLALVVLALAAAIGGSAWLLAPRVGAQADQLAVQLPEALARLEERVGHYEWGRRLLRQAPNAGEMLFSRGNVLSRVTGVFSTTLGIFTNFVIILFVGLYLAAQPRLYAEGLVRLVPSDGRGRAREVLSAVGEALRRWLLGRVALMLANGVLTALGLWLLGMPLALTLGLLAALLNFVPNIGPVIAGLPAVLIAMVEGPTQALYVFLLYLSIQILDGYLLTPLVDRRTVSLPPALTITAQVLFGVLVGGLGVVLASPLTAAVLVLVKMLYVEDALGDPVETPGDSSRTSAPQS